MCPAPSPFGRRAIPSHGGGPVTLRALTDAEARVIAVLLSARPDRERDRLNQIGVPRSTYHAVRRRAYAEGWLRDRYIPHPLPLGLPWVTALVARPYADRHDRFVERVSSDPGNVLLWSDARTCIAVFFHATAAEPRKLVDRLASEQLSAPPTVVTTRADGPLVPVYFDFEGLWCNLAGLDGTLAYPHGLGGGWDEEEGTMPTLSAHQRWAIRELLERPFAASDQGRGGHLVGPFGLPFSQRKMLAKGWVTHRTLLDPSRLPPFRGRAADQIVLVAGTPRRDARPDELFAVLTREARVFPFLFMVGADRWLLGALGAANPPSDAARPPRRPVLPTLQQYLEGIEILQEGAAGFSAPVDHRYDRLLLPEESRPSKKTGHGIGAAQTPDS